ncbi:MAG: hypothetical protein QOH80_852 [Actinomycetota bacterium]|nr:hypothetical protein [Actinomycetota bacterium]
MTAGDGAFAGLSSDELRATVRAVLRDVLPAAVTDRATSSSRGPDGSIELVRLGTDGELDAFVRRIAGMCEDPAKRVSLRDGRTRFRLVGATAESAGEGPSESGPTATGAVLRVERGAVTERRIKQAAAEGARLVIGPKAVLTPLARDKARTLGVVVERER